MFASSAKRAHAPLPPPPPPPHARRKFSTLCAEYTCAVAIFSCAICLVRSILAACSRAALAVTESTRYNVPASMGIVTDKRAFLIFCGQGDQCRETASYSSTLAAPTRASG